MVLTRTVLGYGSPQVSTDVTPDSAVAKVVFAIKPTAELRLKVLQQRAQQQQRTALLVL